MCRVPVGSAERAFIQERIDRFEDEAPEELLWLLPHVREHGALPLYVGWTETAGIRPNGELIRWSTEGWPGAFELGDVWQKIALVKGSERYAQLRRLVPARPRDARDCETCKGSGRLPVHPEVICQCGGVGWVE